MVAGLPAGVTGTSAMSILSEAKPRIVSRKFCIGLMASCIGLLALNGPALGTPAANDTQATGRAETNRAAQLRRARTMQHAARQPAAALVARAHVAEKPP